MNDKNQWQRKADKDILHIAKAIIQCEMALNHEVDKMLALLGLTREDVVNNEVDKL